MLTICPTPIGNLEDVTPRQLRALSQADVIACEDTRVTGKLLELLGIVRNEGKPRLLSLHDHNEHVRADEVLRLLQDGVAVTLVSDAGTPALADPGYRLVSLARAQGVDVTCLPGPFAAAVALAGSGLPTDQFHFGGFLPQKGAARSQALARQLGEHTLVLYEAPGRVMKLLQELKETAPKRRVCLARELTKMHEEWLQGPAEELIETLSARERIRGEFVVVIEGMPLDISAAEVERVVAALRKANLSPQQIKSIGAELTGRPRSEIYRVMEVLKNT